MKERRRWVKLKEQTEEKKKMYELTYTKILILGSGEEKNEMYQRDLFETVSGGTN